MVVVFDVDIALITASGVDGSLSCVNMFEELSKVMIT
jgi:hypothetical protein